LAKNIKNRAKVLLVANTFGCLLNMFQSRSGKVGRHWHGYIQYKELIPKIRVDSFSRNVGRFRQEYTT
jgi:hypothetical protein